MTPAARADLRELKEHEPFTGLRVDNRDGVPCKFQILGRGEMAFFQLGERALLFELLAGPAVIFAKTIRRWDDGSHVTDDEREQIIEIASSFLTSKGAAHVEVVR